MNTSNLSAISSNEIERFTNNLQSNVICGSSILPFEIHAKSNDMELKDWIKLHKDEINSILYKYGAILFKGFGIDNAQKLGELGKAHAGELLGYIERGAPRLSLADNVFTSTEYAKEEVIPMHHEMSYSHNWPSKLYFCSEVVADEGGFTPLADDRKVFAAIPEHIKAKFMEKKLMYVRNYGLGIDMDWEEAFQSTNKAEVEKYLQSSNTTFEWMPGNVLRTKVIRQAVATHPVTKDTVWFNHAHLFHSSNMPCDIREMLIEEFGEEGMPRNAYFGDGTSLDDAELNLIRELYKEHSVTFQWEKGDALFIDNFLLTHGRSPFKGQRKVCVAMSELYVNKEL